MSVAGQFYCGLFGWRLDAETDVSSFQLRDLTVATARATTDARPNAWISHVSVEDIAVTSAVVQSAGGSVLTEPISREPLGSSALMADSQGAVFGLWQPGRLQGAQLIDEPGATCWADVRARDHDKATSFYGAVFDWKERSGEAVPGMTYSEWWSRGRVVAGMTELAADVPAEVPSHWHTTFEVTECSDVVGRCLELGGSVLLEPLDIKVGEYAQLADPQGGSFGVISLLPGIRS